MYMIQKRALRGVCVCVCVCYYYWVTKKINKRIDYDN